MEEIEIDRLCQTLDTLPCLLALQVCLVKFMPRPIRRLKSCPEMVPVQAITANPRDERLELLYKSPKEFPIAMIDAPRITGFISKTAELNFISPIYTSIRSTIAPAAVDSQIREQIIFRIRIIHCIDPEYDSFL